MKVVETTDLQVNIEDGILLKVFINKIPMGIVSDTRVLESAVGDIRVVLL